MLYALFSLPGSQIGSNLHETLFSWGFSNRGFSNKEKLVGEVVESLLSGFFFGHVGMLG